MNFQEFKSLNLPHPRFRISADSIDGSLDDRTLLYGLMSDGKYHHLYLKEGELYSYRYEIGNPDGSSHAAGSIGFLLGTLLPDGKLLPEFCDFEFCRELMWMNIHLDFYPFGTSFKVNAPRIAGEDPTFWIYLDSLSNPQIAQDYHNKYGAIEGVLRDALVRGDFDDFHGDVNHDALNNAREELRKSLKYESANGHVALIREIKLPPHISRLPAEEQRLRNPAAYLAIFIDGDGQDIAEIKQFQSSADAAEHILNIAERDGEFNDEDYASIDLEYRERAKHSLLGGNPFLFADYSRAFIRELRL